ncbi:MAG: rhodanese-like domain-containing protein [Anaerolineae bacterium]
MSFLGLPWWWPLGRVPEITPESLAATLAQTSPQIVDVRTAQEFANGHIEGAASLPITAFSARWRDLGLDPDRPVVLICLSAHRSIPATRLLQRHGFDAQQLAGGMQAWRARHLPETSTTE